MDKWSMQVDYGLKNPRDPKSISVKRTQYITLRAESPSIFLDKSSSRFV